MFQLVQVALRFKFQFSLSCNKVANRVKDEKQKKYLYGPVVWGGGECFVVYNIGIYI